MTIKKKMYDMNDVCRFSRDHVVECSERTVLSCLEPVCSCWRRFQWHILPTDYMQGTETTALTTTSQPPKVWERHVDDVFSII